ncbi:unnamed protein product, partial [marine sediment metagenome]
MEKEKWERELNKMLKNYTDDGYFDLVNGYIPLEQFIQNLLKSEIDKAQREKAKGWRKNIIPPIIRNAKLEEKVEIRKMIEKKEYIDNEPFKAGYLFIRKGYEKAKKDILKQLK